MDEAGPDVEECSRKVVSGRRVADAISSLVNAKNWQIECASLARNIACTCPYVRQCETVLWNEKERSKIGAVQLDNPRGLFGIRRMDRAPDKGVVGVTKEV